MRKRVLALAIVVAAAVARCQEGEPTSITGMWDDGLVGENTMICLSTNGTGDVISEACFTIHWTLDPNTKVLSMTYVRQRDHKEETLLLTYDTKSETLSGRLYGTNDVARTFRRASQKKVDWWAGIKQKTANNTSVDTL